MDAGAARPMELSTNLQVGANNVALIVGVTGLVGKELTAILKRRGWKVYGVARRSLPSLDCIFIPCDLLDRKETMEKLSQLQDVTHIFWVTWCSEFPADSQEGCVQNEIMMVNGLDAVLGAAKSLKHLSLQTGTAHYLPVGGHDVRSDHGHEHGETSKVTAMVSKRATTVDGVDYSYYYDEESPRPPNGINFYYTLEDVARKRLSGRVGWSVHRPGLLIGNSVRTELNVMGSLCVYGSVCKHLGLPFLFGGSRECWEETCLDASDARMVAEQQIWAATAGPKLQQREDQDRGQEEGALVVMDGEAFNVVNGSPFTWKEVWPALAAKFGLAAPAGCGDDDDPFFSEQFSYVKAMGDKGVVWEEIVQKNGLRRTRMEELGNWWFLDALFRMPFKLLVSREKSDRLGFTSTCNTLTSILYWVDCMRDDKVVP